MNRTARLTVLQYFDAIRVTRAIMHTVNHDMIGDDFTFHPSFITDHERLVGTNFTFNIAINLNITRQFDISSDGTTLCNDS